MTKVVRIKLWLGKLDEVNKIFQVPNNNNNSLGLNSILDLTSSSAPKRLFINNWNVLRGLFGQRFKPGIKIDGKLDRRISQIEKICVY